MASQLDVQEVAALLDIFEKANSGGDQFKNIRDQALLRLRQINEDHKPTPTPMPAPPPSHKEDDSSSKRKSV